MKKISLVIVSLTMLGTLLTGCSSATSSPTPVKKVIKVEKTQAELDAETKSKAVIADFVAINGHEKKLMGKEVFAEGKVGNVNNGAVMNGAVAPTFLLSVKEKGGYGVYAIVNLDGNTFDLKKGDTVKVYGSIMGAPAASGLPQIINDVLEKK